MSSAFAKRYLGAAAFVLLSGCDYWEGLVGDKTITKSAVAITFLDAWTNVGLQGVVCNEASRKLSLASDNQGLAAIGSAGTGEYLFACSVPYFFDTTFELKVTKGINTHTIRLARKGGVDWYTDAERMARIIGPTSTVRFPKNIVWYATPFDTTGRFRFEWTFKSAPKLSHVPGPGELPSHFLKPRFEDWATAAAGVFPGPDTVCLKVYSHLRGKHSEYFVGSECIPFAWTLNKRPTLSFDRDTTNVRSGCSGPTWKAGSTLRVKFTAKDSDGTCDSVRFYSKGNSAFGKVDTTYTCEERQTAEFRLHDPFGSQVGPDYTLTLDNFLYVTAYDDNKETTEDTLLVITKSNRVPVTSGGWLNAQKRYIVGDRVNIWVQGTDGDGPIEGIQIMWEHPDTSKFTPDTTFQPTFRKESYHIYRTPGTYKIKVHAIDNCPAVTSFEFPPLTIYENAPPRISFSPWKTFAQGQLFHHIFRLTIQDKDVDDSLDRFESIKVNWGDGTLPDSTFMPLGAEYDEDHVHAYQDPPPGGASVYNVAIEVRDAHNGISDTTFTIPYVPD